MKKLFRGVEIPVCKWSSWNAFVGIGGCCFPIFMDLACFFGVADSNNGVADSNNDVNVLDQSPIFIDILS